MKGALITVTLLLILVNSSAQGDDSLLYKATNFPSKLFSRISGKYSDLESKIEKKTVKTLKRIEKQEKELRFRLKRKGQSNQLIDSLTLVRYDDLINKIKGRAGSMSSAVGDYIPYLDSLKTGLSLLNNIPSKQGFNNAGINALESMNRVTDKLQLVREIQIFLKERKQVLKDSFSKLGLANKVRKINKDVYYYSAQIQEYRNLLRDNKKLEEKAVSYLKQLPAFKEFMKENSMLSKLSPPRFVSHEPE